MDKITRKQALKAIPLTPAVLNVETLDNGGAKVTVARPTSTMQRKLLRMPDTVKKEFELDPFGRQILEWCDGKNSVGDILEKFIETHGMDPHESEKAVSTFLRTLIARGMVTMELSGKKM